MNDSLRSQSYLILSCLKEFSTGFWGKLHTHKKVGHGSAENKGLHIIIYLNECDLTYVDKHFSGKTSREGSYEGSHEDTLYLNLREDIFEWKWWEQRNRNENSSMLIKEELIF